MQQQLDDHAIIADVLEAFGYCLNWPSPEWEACWSNHRIESIRIDGILYVTIIENEG